ncbi:hypothetical protein BaRGS_00002241 [Batillaria attramentaria]|uniref:Uncharacterized protein n=1 Tax=Batillaria attramentaria TaxID=370345 RepID=A0ABD0M5R2_9CAEN
MMMAASVEPIAARAALKGKRFMKDNGAGLSFTFFFIGVYVCWTGRMAEKCSWDSCVAGDERREAKFSNRKPALWSLTAAVVD